MGAEKKWLWYNIELLVGELFHDSTPKIASHLKYYLLPTCLGGCL